jgi:mannose-6-phosphate isomerase-like protein (cupin superfamily)
MPSFLGDGEIFPVSELRARRERSGEQYLEFLRIPAMSVGLYSIPAGGVDPQTPHREDEIYYVIRGRASFTLAGRDRPVEPGATIFVAKGVDHRFHSVKEDLDLLVVFAPEESPDPEPPPSAPSRDREGSHRPSKGS